jgi:hypothetical protein
MAFPSLWKDQMMTQQGSVILLEFNELTPSLMSRFIAEGRLPNFKRLYDESRVFTTDATEDVRHDKWLLNPWVQWVTLHTGVNAPAHGIKNLGEAGKLTHKALTEVVSNARLPVLVHGTMNVRYGRDVTGVVVPDPWTTDVEPQPAELIPYYRFVQKNVREHTGGEEGLTAGEILAFVRFMVTHGLSLSTVLAIARQLASELTGRYGWRRVAILDRIQWDVFRHYYKRIKPHFATFFLNSTAHLQHKFWRNMDPEPFTIKPNAREQAELQHAVVFGYEQMDALLGRFMRLAGKDTTLIFSTAISQQPCLIYEDSGGKTFYKSHDIDKVLRFAGLKEPYTYSAAMSDEFHLAFEDAATAARAALPLTSLSVEGQPALRVSHQGKRLVCGAITSQMPENASLESATGARVPFFDMFYQAGGLKSGMHHPDGMLWIRLPDRSHAVARERVPLTAVAPTILRLLDVTPPASMQTDDLLGLGPSREAEFVAAAAERRAS